MDEDRVSEMGNAVEIRESTLCVHVCFLIKSMSQREEHIRYTSVKLLNQIREKFPQVELQIYIPAVISAAASGANFKLTGDFNLEVLGTDVVSARGNSNYAKEITGMRRLYENMESIDERDSDAFISFELFLGFQESYLEHIPNKSILERIHLMNYYLPEKCGEVDKSSFRDTCSQLVTLVPRLQILCLKWRFSHNSYVFFVGVQLTFPRRIEWRLL